MNSAVIGIAILLILYGVALKLTPQIPITPSTVAGIAVSAGVGLLLLALASRIP